MTDAQIEALKDWVRAIVADALADQNDENSIVDAVRLIRLEEKLKETFEGVDG